MAYSNIKKPSDYFNTKLYTGNGSSQAITGVNFEPDFLWIKGRSGARNHSLFDIVRGNDKRIISNTNGAETTETSVTSFDTDGFTLDSGTTSNANGETFVAWNWKAGTSFTNDASSTGVGSIDSTGSVNTDAGFSIISYTGTGSAGTVAHGLGAVPKMIIIKSRNTTSLWGVYHQAIGNTHGLFLNATNAATSLSAYWNNTSPTSSVFSLGGDADINKSSDPLIAYCFAEKQGYSKFGSYVGNSNANGTFIYTGMKPSFILIKSSSDVTNWQIYDNKRLGYNVDNNALRANLSNAELTDNDIDILSNGFKIRKVSDQFNGGAFVYQYLAFAENPFVTSTGIPTTAR